MTLPPRPWLRAWGAFLLLTPILLFPSINALLTAAALIGVVVLWIGLLRRRPPAPPSPLALPLILWGLMLIVGILVSADPALTLEKASGLVLGMTAVFLCHHTLQTPRTWLYALAATTLLALGFIAIGLLNTAWLIKIPALEGIIQLLPAGLIPIPDGTDSVSANQLAGTTLFLFAPLLSFAFYWLQSKRTVKTTLLIAVPLLFTSLIILLSQSRTTWLSVAGLMLTQLLLWWRFTSVENPARKWYFRGAALLLLLGFSSVLLIGPRTLFNYLDEPAKETLVGSLTTINFRQEVWQWGLVATGDFPFTGVGLGTFRQMVRRLYPLAVTPSYDIAHAHNIFLQTALDLGLPGLIIYLAILMLTAVIALQTARRSPRWRPWALALLSALIGVHLFGLTDALALGSKPGLLQWLVTGLIFTLPTVANFPPRHAD